MFLVLGFCLKNDDNFDVYNMTIILVFIMMIIMMMMIMIMTISIFMMMMMAMCRAIAEIFTASAGITPVMRSVSLH